MRHKCDSYLLGEGGVGPFHVRPRRRGRRFLAVMGLVSPRLGPKRAPTYRAWPGKGHLRPGGELLMARPVTDGLERGGITYWSGGRGGVVNLGTNKKIKFVKLKDNYNYWKVFWRFWDIITWKVRLNSSESLLLPCISEFKFTCAWLGFRSPI